MTIFVDKRKLSQESSPAGADGGRGADRNSNATGTVTLEALHQLAASYFTDRESTLRRLHHLQIASTAIRVCGSHVAAVQLLWLRVGKPPSATRGNSEI